MINYLLWIVQPGEFIVVAHISAAVPELYALTCTRIVADVA